MEEIEHIMNQVARGATFTLTAHDWLNPQHGYRATLEGPRGKVSYDGDYVPSAIGKLEIALQNGEVRVL